MLLHKEYLKRDIATGTSYGKTAQERPSWVKLTQDFRLRVNDAWRWGAVTFQDIPVGGRLF